MRKFIYICFTVCFVSVFVSAQSQPFETFSKAVKEQRGGFSGNKENLSTVFNQERIKLGENFETELWKYLGSDVEKHYWISFFLSSKSYLHGNTSLPELAFEIRRKGLVLLENKDDKKSLGRKVVFSRQLAVAAQKFGKQDLAINYKNNAESLLSRNEELSAYITSMSEYDLCIYKNLEKDSSFCREDDTPKEKIISSGFINSKARELPNPDYPKELKKRKVSGQVFVKVLIDYDGNVISAEATKGAIELFEVSVEAAKKAKFTPTTLSGKPVKVSGVIIYNFVR